MNGAPDAAEAPFESWELLSGVVPGGWSRRLPDMLAAVTRLPVSTLNGVWACSAQADQHDAVAGLDEVAASGVPYCFQFPIQAPALEALARARLMHRDEDIPLMVLRGQPTITPGTLLSVRRLGPAEVRLHASVAALGFGAPLDVFTPLVTPAVAATDGLGFYIGDAEGDHVTTGLGVAIGAFVGVFNIATPEQFRRRGYGAAITAHLIRDAYATGTSWAWLQSSLDGHDIYRRLGFRTSATWQCWTSA